MINNTSIMNKVLLLFSLLFSTSIFAQTIVNAEQLNSSNDSLTFSLQMTYEGTRGNAVTDEFDLAPSVSLVKKKNNFKLFGGYSVLSEESNTLLNSGFAHIRHNYKISNRLKTFEFYQIQFNEVLLLTKRELFGAGLRYSIVAEDSVSFDLGIGFMQENEFLNNETLMEGEITDTHFIRGATVSSFQWIINETVQINNVFYYQPNMIDLSDYRILNDFMLTTQVSDEIYFIASFTARYDSKPPSSLTGFDSKFNVGVGYTFSK